MARSIETINAEIISVKESVPELSALSSNSKVSIWRLWAYVTAVCAWTLENLFDIHVKETTDLIESSRHAYIPWMHAAALNFQYGYDLVKDQVYYDNTGIDEDTIAASKVVKYVAIQELQRGLMIKVAAENNGELVPLTAAQLEAFKKYIGRIKPPGVGIRFVNKTADGLKLQMRIYYNPLILDGTGKRLDGTNDTPVQDAVTAFLKTQPFNGQYILNRQERAVEAVEGVVIAPVLHAEAMYEDVGYQPFTVFVLPDSGYLRFLNPADLTLEFVAHENL